MYEWREKEKAAEGKEEVSGRRKGTGAPEEGKKGSENNHARGGGEKKSFGKYKKDKEGDSEKGTEKIRKYQEGTREDEERTGEDHVGAT